MNPKRLQLKGMLAESKKRFRTLDTEASGTILIIRSQLNPYEEITNLDTDKVLVLSHRLNKIVAEMKELKEKIKNWSKSLNSKKQYFDEAERLYVLDYCSLEEIANRLKLNRKTVMAWKEQGDWNNKRKKFLLSKQSFHEELYEFARKLMKDITSDIDAGEKVDPGRMYAFCKIIPMFTKVKDYEDIVAKKEQKETHKGLTPELIAQIEEEVLGIKHDDNEE